MLEILRWRYVKKGANLSDVKFLSNFMFFSREKNNDNGVHSQGLWQSQSHLVLVVPKAEEFLETLFQIRLL